MTETYTYVYRDKHEAQETVDFIKDHLKPGHTISDVYLLGNGWWKFTITVNTTEEGQQG